MTEVIGIHPVEVSDEIAAIVVEGLTIKKLEDMPDSVSDRELPMMLPAPTFVSGYELVLDTYGGGGAGQMTAKYTLNYRLFSGEVGTKRGLASHYKPLTTLWAAVANALRVNDHSAHAAILEAGTPTGYGKVPAPDDKQFYGCDVGIRVTELIN